MDWQAVERAAGGSDDAILLAIGLPVATGNVFAAPVEVSGGAAGAAAGASPDRATLLPRWVRQPAPYMAGGRHAAVLRFRSAAWGVLTCRYRAQLVAAPPVDRG